MSSARGRVCYFETFSRETLAGAHKLSSNMAQWLAFLLSFSNIRTPWFQFRLVADVTWCRPGKNKQLKDIFGVCQNTCVYMLWQMLNIRVEKWNHSLGSDLLLDSWSEKDRQPENISSLGPLELVMSLSFSFFFLYNILIISGLNNESVWRQLNILLHLLLLPY